MRSRIYPGDGDPRHGTLNGYSNLLCRCDECRAVMRDYNAESKRRRVRSAEKPHGTASGYFNWGCRCDDCMLAVDRGSRLSRARQVFALAAEGRTAREIADAVGITRQAVEARLRRAGMGHAYGRSSRYRSAWLSARRRANQYAALLAEERRAAS